MPARGQSKSKALGGTCVSGSQNVTGRVFVVQDETAIDDSAFSGFKDGDIIVCRMISPAWLPWVQRSGGVLSEVGGWLSHMAIVARERGILLLVGCTGLDQLKTGMTVNARTDGAVSVDERTAAQSRKTA
ncbi:Phosphoenolpyruvate synthase [Roseovarius litorisediminis]|uniref:Phosphoenolpyruvate synthase n=1 Tax=Roseovarius litorisediminis TaxID=1312363 RepID=A0A1Y5T216_9RHOB|nr:Phosphoenolpyruvate synthase [Roseovarius litorisediminis]